MAVADRPVVLNASTIVVFRRQLHRRRPSAPKPRPRALRGTVGSVAPMGPPGGADAHRLAPKLPFLVTPGMRAQ